MAWNGMSTPKLHRASRSIPSNKLFCTAACFALITVLKGVAAALCAETQRTISVEDTGLESLYQVVTVAYFESLPNITSVERYDFPTCLKS